MQKKLDKNSKIVYTVCGESPKRTKEHRKDTKQWIK
jgi:hypothetical protein